MRRIEHAFEEQEKKVKNCEKQVHLYSADSVNSYSEWFFSSMGH